MWRAPEAALRPEVSLERCGPEMKPAVDEMFPEGAGPYVDLDEAGGSTGLLMDLAANEKAVHADFFNDFEDLFDDDDIHSSGLPRTSQQSSMVPALRRGQSEHRVRGKAAERPVVSEERCELNGREVAALDRAFGSTGHGQGAEALMFTRCREHPLCGTNKATSEGKMGTGRLRNSLRKNQSKWLGSYLEGLTTTRSRRDVSEDSKISVSTHWRGKCFQSDETPSVAGGEEGKKTTQPCIDVR
ncbi:COP9 signalosome complex subunit 9 [Pan troglodytes]|uniref:COP9 signalosome complex subunit 9 n=1 Tax=Pan troglodytes TaxID=9598 RepID=UPI0023F36C72|nr:COP9 signalosome complex subunit 9 [Pan troglodytes]